MPSCLILPLQPRWQEAAKQVYDRTFMQADIPYGQQLPGNFLANRLFGSCLWSYDCSRILLTQAGEGVGLALANRRLNPAAPETDWLWLQLFCIAPAWQGRGLGRLLLNNLLETAAATGKRGLATALQWAGIWPGILAGLQTMQTFCNRTGVRWRPGEIYLEKNLLERTAESGIACPSCLGDGVTLLDYDNRHRQSLTALLRDHFSIGWQHEVLSHIDPDYEPFNGYGLAAGPDAHHPSGTILLLEQQSQVVGFCLLQAGTTASIAFFGPIGLQPEWRGYGWGSHLLRAAAHRLRAQGWHRLGLWTSAPLAQRFYAPLGIYPVTTTQHAEWRLPPH